MAEAIPELGNRSQTSDALSRHFQAEWAWTHRFRAGEPFPPNAFERMGLPEKTALLRGLNRSLAVTDPCPLLDQGGLSPDTDSLIRDYLRRVLAGMSASDRVSMLRRCGDKAAVRPEQLGLILDVAAHSRTQFARDTEIDRTLPDWHLHEHVVASVTRYLAGTFEERLDRLVERIIDTGMPVRPTLVLEILNSLLGTDPSIGIPAMRKLLTIESTTDERGSLAARDYVLAALERAPNSSQTSRSSTGPDVAQFALFGQLDQPGKGNSGGLQVFLMSLGDALGEAGGIGHVYTVSLLNIAEVDADDSPPLAERRTPGHTVLRIPFPSSGDLSQREMMAREESLLAAILGALRMHGIAPEVFHIRYSDHGSRAAARVAQQLAKKVVFTVTSDPHGTLTNLYAKPSLTDDEEDALAFALHRVYIADDLVDMADALVTMTDDSRTVSLRTFFPQIYETPAGPTKPLGVLGEGLPLGWKAATHESIVRLLDGDACRVVSGGAGPEQAQAFCERPMMLNVGRIHPVKQQDVLVDAWAGSDLWRTYNLVIIGGNQERPSPIERGVLDRIRATLERYPKADPWFVMLPAMPNSDLRALEHGIIRELGTDKVHVYVCSSLKEEFGIANLEAMEAGFLVFGPERGGLASYMTSGENGFLMDTATASGIAETLTNTLLSGQYGDEDLRSIARAGTLTVQNRFDIRSVARGFAEFYLDATERQVSGPE